MTVAIDREDRHATGLACVDVSLDEAERPRSGERDSLPAAPPKRPAASAERVAGPQHDTLADPPFVRHGVHQFSSGTVAMNSATACQSTWSQRAW